MFEIGELIDNRFEVLSDLGRGGMGAVFRVRDEERGEEIALKICLEPDLEGHRRFAREVRFMASVEHDHVMPVFSHNLDHSPPYFTMPLAECSLADELTTPMEDREALKAFHQICLGVQAVHNADGTHRDIKPLNIMRLDDGRLVISDLGLVKLDPRDTTTLTQTSQFVGTRIYCAPEQLVPGGSKNADVRTDIYQLGKALYEMLTGEPPALIDRTQISPALAHIIDRATQQHPSQRYSSIGAMMDAAAGILGATEPGASPQQRFEAALEEAQNHARTGRYRSENLLDLLGNLLQLQDDEDDYLEQLRSVPDDLLELAARNHPESLLPVLEAQSEALEMVVARYNFAYAEFVAQRMQRVFFATDDSRVKAFALKATLIAAVDLNRYAAMDTFNTLLTAISNTEDALAIADVLGDEISRYRVLADTMPKGRLHPMLVPVYRDAIGKDSK